MLSLDEIRNAAKYSDMAALLCSLQHHREGVATSLSALLDFHVNGDYCACCYRWDCDCCPLWDDACCSGLWDKAQSVLKRFKRTGCGLRRFRAAERNIIAYIQGVIDATESEVVLEGSEGRL